MKPIPQYQSPEPAAMGRMGEGIPQAGANIAASIKSGWDSIASAISSVGGMTANAASKYQSNKAQNNVTKSLLSSDETSKILGVQGEDRINLLKKFNETISNDGQRGGAEFSRQVLTPIHEYANIGRLYAQQQLLAGARKGIIPETGSGGGGLDLGATSNDLLNPPIRAVPQTSSSGQAADLSLPVESGTPTSSAALFSGSQGQSYADLPAEARGKLANSPFGPDSSGQSTWDNLSIEQKQNILSNLYKQNLGFPPRRR